MSYPIIKIAAQYIDGFAQAVDSVARELRYLAFTEGPPLETTVAYVQQNLAEDWPHFIALDGEKVIGWCDIASLHRPVLEHSGVLGLGVIREYRGLGIGTRLISTALQAAKERGLSRVVLTVRERNEIAIQLYKSFGFFQEGRHIKAVKINGHYENHLSMELLISEND
ncbi:GNAT family N-acetyltransferase [Methylobacter sp.]|uniref:GNAT family N-acetyltransferase n=1 Tax=Methylobacter sp. TaxID=2051955 RepID=UPI002FDEF2C0